VSSSPVVMFETLWADVSDGWAIAARVYARAMKMAGATVYLHSWLGILEELAPEVIEEVGEMSSPCPEGKWDFYMFSTPLASPEIMHEPLQMLSQARAPRTFYTMFERTSVQGAIVDQLNCLDGVMVPCMMNADGLKDAGCKNAVWIPYPYFDDDPHLKLETPRGQARKFLWIGRWEPRKAPHMLIRAFLLAFKPGEAELTLKLGLAEWKTTLYMPPESVAQIELDYADVRRNGWTKEKIQESIHVIRGRLTPREMLELHQKNDVYVSASRGEGIDLPSFHAKLAGRRVVTTDSGGPVDFLTENDVLVQTPATIAAIDYENLWGRGSRYRDYSIDDLVAALQHAVSMPHKQYVMPEQHRAELVGQRLLNWIEGCRGRN